MTFSVTYKFNGELVTTHIITSSLDGLASSLANISLENIVAIVRTR